MLEESGKVAESVNIVVLHLQTVVGTTSNHDSVVVDSIEVLAKLTTCVSERVLGDGVPESVFGIAWAERDPAADEADFIDAFGYQMADVVPQFSRETG